MPDQTKSDRNLTEIRLLAEDLQKHPIPSDEIAQKALALAHEHLRKAYDQYGIYRTFLRKAEEKARRAERHARLDTA